MKKLSRIIVCFILVIALVLSTAACKPAKPTPEVTPTQKPVVTATPTPEKTPTPVTPTPAPTKKPGGEITFPDGWDKPIDTKKDVTAEQASALTGNGTYYLDPKTGDSVTNESFTGTLIIDNKTALDALTVNMPNASIEFKGEYKDLTVTSGQHTARFAPSARITGKLTILGGNVLAEALAEIKALEVPVENTTTSNVQLLGAVLGDFSTAAPIELTFKAPATAQTTPPTFTNSAVGTVLEVIGSLKALEVTNAASSTLVIDATQATQATAEDKLAVANSGTLQVVAGDKTAAELIDHGNTTKPTPVVGIAGLAVEKENFNSAANHLATGFNISATDALNPADIKSVVVELFAGSKLVSTNTMTAFGIQKHISEAANKKIVQFSSPFYPIEMKDQYWNFGTNLIKRTDKVDKFVVTVTPRVGAAVTATHTAISTTPEEYQAIFDATSIASDFVQKQSATFVDEWTLNDNNNLTYNRLGASFNFKSNFDAKKSMIQSLTATLNFANGQKLVHTAKLSAWIGVDNGTDAYFFGSDGLSGDIKADRTWWTAAPIITKEMGNPKNVTLTVTDKMGNVSSATSDDITAGELAKFPSIFTDVKVKGTKTIAANETLTIPVGMTLTIPAGATLTNSGKIVNNGTIKNKGAIDGLGTVSGSGNIIDIIESDGKLKSEVTKAVASDTPTTIVSELAKTPQELVDLVKGITGIKDKNIVIKNTNKGELYYLAFVLQGLYQELCSEGLTNVWLATVTTYGGELVAINNKATISYSYDGVDFEKMPFTYEVITGGNVPLGSENQNSAWKLDATKPFVWFKVDSIAENTIEIAWQHSNGTYNVQNAENGKAVKVNVELLKGVYGDNGIWFIVNNPSKPRECTYKVSKPYDTTSTPDTFAQNFIGYYKTADGSDVIRFAENGGVVKSLLPGEVKAGKDDSATGNIDESKTPVPAWGSVAGTEYVKYIVGVDGAIVSKSAKLGGYWDNAYFTWNEDYTQITITEDHCYKISLGAKPKTKTLTAGTVFTKVIISTVTTSEELETAVAAGGTVILGNDITLLKQITIAKDVAVVLDSNAKKVTYNGAGARPIINNGNLTVIGKGIFEVTDAGSYGVIDNYGQLTITDCTFTSEDAAGDGAMLKNRPAGVMTLNNVTAISNSKADNGNACVASDGKLTINGGSYSNNSGLTKKVGAYCIVIKKGVSEINNPTVYGAKGALGLSGGNNTINGGKYSATNYSAIYIAGGYEICTATINDGDFESVGFTCVRIGNSTPGDGGACLKASAFIKGGQFNAKGTETKIINVDEALGNPSITGGKFSQDIDDGVYSGKKFVAEGYECVKDGNTNWYIVRKKA